METPPPPRIWHGRSVQCQLNRACCQYPLSLRAKAEHGGIIYGDDTVYKTYANTVQVKVTAGADDGFSGGDVFDNTDTWYEAGQPYNAWIVLPGITIPAGAVIDEAHLAVVVNRWDTARCSNLCRVDQEPAAATSITDHAGRRRTSKAWSGPTAPVIYSGKTVRISHQSSRNWWTGTVYQWGYPAINR